ncbi:MAG: DUF4934 domain-containing protein [Bacteroides sp.]|nr:DUF4934 domain-containing protein [Bacteroides sp.]
MTLKNLSLILSAGVLAGCAYTAETRRLDTVNVAAAIENPTKITTSQLGSKIRFVPLETSDASLIANDWTIAFTDDRAIVGNFGTEAGVLVFDLHDGQFLNRVGQIGAGPEDYANPFFLIDPVTSQLIFMSGNGNGYLAYNTDGTYCGKVLPGFDTRSAMPIGVADSIVYAATPGFNRERLFRAIHMDSEPVDSFIAFKGQSGGDFPNGFNGLTIYDNFNGPLRHSMQDMRQVQNQGHTYIVKSVFPITTGQHTGFKETMCDTVYRLTPSAAVPELIFDMGSHSFPINDLNRKDIKSDNLIVTDVNVTPKKAVFGVSRGWIGDEDHTLYIGTYDRQTGETRIALASDGITDDLGGFIPFAPAFSNPKGDLIGVLTTDDIEEWYGENPDFPRPEWLNTLPDDSNPILVIVSE